MAISKAKTAPSQQESQLFANILSLANSPLDHAMYTLPWGQPNTPLSSSKGPKDWQKQVMMEIEQHLRSNRNKTVNKLPPELFRYAIASGRGIGKSAMSAMLVKWFMDTTIGGTAIVTANRKDQLESYTFAEIGKWFTLAINSHWWERTLLSVTPSPWFEDLIRRQLKIDTQYYYARGQLWSEENPDAFAGAHSTYGTLVLFDEASGIAPPIWDVSEGFFSDLTERRFWMAWSNPRKNTGKFFECFHKNRELWRHKQIDSRTVEGLDHQVFNAIVKQHGPDSDQAKVEVYGQFPSQSDRQFISRQSAMEAQERELTPDPQAPLIMGVDLAAGGDDNVIVFRRGWDARAIPIERWRERDTMVTVDRIVSSINKYNPDAIAVDSGGLGAPIVDRLRQLRYPVSPINGANSSSDKTRFANKRAEMWWRMKEWLETLGTIPMHDVNLFDDLVSVEEVPDNTRGVIQLERKDQMKKRGLSSPDSADALALTHAVTPARKDLRSLRRRRKVVQVQTDNVVFT